MAAHFVSHTGAEALAEHIRRAGCTLTDLPEAQASAADAGKLVEAAAARRPPAGWIAVDGYHFDTAYLDIVARSDVRLAVIDDIAAHERYPADLLLNQNIGAQRGRYVTKPACKLLIGPRYALLRAEFSGWRGWRREYSSDAKRILVTLGGGGAGGTLATVLAALAAVEGRLEIRVLASAADAGYSLRAAIGKAEAAGHVVELHGHSEDMPSNIAWADLAVAAGGSTVWELAYMQTPSLLVVLAENQRGNVEGLASLGFAVSLGDASRIEVAELARRVAELLADAERREEMGRAGRALVDGRGAQRAAEEIRGWHA